MVIGHTMKIIIKSDFNIRAFISKFDEVLCVLYIFLLKINLLQLIFAASNLFVLCGTLLLFHASRTYSFVIGTFSLESVGYNKRGKTSIKL